MKEISTSKASYQNGLLGVFLGDIQLDVIGLQVSNKKIATVQVFQHVLHFVYDGCEPDKHTMMKIGKESIDAAHRFGMIELSILVENTLIKGCVANVKNFVGDLLFAESKA
jgi:hypothetical protein